MKKKGKVPRLEDFRRWMRRGEPPGELEVALLSGLEGVFVAGNGWRFRTRAEVELISGRAGTTSVAGFWIGMEWTKVGVNPGQRRGPPQPLL